jgi:mono/diheme cytochrome c family protein
MMMSVRVLLLVALLLVTFAFFGCAPKPPAGTETPSTPGATTTTPGPTAAAPTGEALGEQIYKTGVGVSGAHIGFTKGGAKFVAKPGGCANCHGEDGMGKKLPKFDIPPIRYSVLFEPQDGKPAKYTAKTIRKAVVTGVDEEGKPLDPIMPRWKMTDDELTALAAYLKVLDTKPAAPAKPMGPAKPAPAKPMAPALPKTK